MNIPTHIPMLKKLLFLTLSIVVGGGLFTTYSNNQINSAGPEMQAMFAQADTVTALQDPKTFEGAPVGKVESFPVANPKGMVVLVPQSHKSPGSTSASAVNDKPLVAQKEIHSLLKRMTESLGMQNILVEGAMIGAPTDEKVQSIADLNKLRNEYAGNATKLKSVVSQTDAPALKAVDQSLSSIERELYLSGAPYLVKAENNQVNVLGVEDPELHKRSAEIVRDYTYQKDRIAVLNKAGKSKGSSLNQAFSLGEKSDSSATQNKLIRLMQLKKKLAQKSTSAGSVSQSLKKLKQTNSQNPEVNAAIAATEESVARINAFTQQQKQKSASQQSSTAPSRAQNPYANVTDLDELQKIHNQTTQKIQEVIVDERNVSVAKNTAQIFEDKNISNGILVFGAGHTEGLIKELNKQGLSVVVVTPQSVQKK